MTVPAKEEIEMEKLAELVDASLKFTRVLKRKGVSQATLQVAVRSRPLTKTERARGELTLTRLVDDKIVVVMDPDELRKDPNKKQPEVFGGAKKIEKRYVFDMAFDGSANNKDIYARSVAPLVGGVLKGLNATVFAYGATGSGKTYTMVGSDADPGLMVCALRDIFGQISREREKEWEVSCSYLEVYNEVIYDLLIPNSGACELREDPELGPTVAGLKRIKVQSAEKIFSLLREGNMRRKTESTDANATSSRSHAVLEIVVNRSDRNHYSKQVYTGKMALVDLAGAERASETNNRGNQLRDGANINRSLLALANCINALGKRKRKGFVFVPFRNSKLTRLLKDGLCGNSRTCMIATVSSADSQYSHTVNTLKYADRAKEIKTHVRRNAGTVQEHVAEYQRMIDQLHDENKELRLALQQGGGAPPSPSGPLFEKNPLARSYLTMRDGAGGGGTGGIGSIDEGAAFAGREDDPQWVESTSAALAANSAERARLQGELLSVEEKAVRARHVLEQLDAQLATAQEAAGGGGGGAPEELRALEERRDGAAEGPRACEEHRGRLQRAAADSEAARAKVEGSVEPAVTAGRMRLAMQAQLGRHEIEKSEARVHISARDGIIQEQQGVVANLWQLLQWCGIERARAFEVAAEHGLGTAALMGDDLLGTSGDAQAVGLRLEQQLTGSLAAKRHAFWREKAGASESLADGAPTTERIIKASEAEALGGRVLGGGRGGGGGGGAKSSPARRRVQSGREAQHAARDDAPPARGGGRGRDRDRDAEDWEAPGPRSKAEPSPYAPRGGGGNAPPGGLRVLKGRNGRRGVAVRSSGGLSARGKRAGGYGPQNHRSSHDIEVEDLGADLALQGESLGVEH